jgi:hypothetical protein
MKSSRDNFEGSDEQLLARRKAGFAVFKSERLPVLHEFCTSLGFEQPHEVLNTPGKFLAQLDSGFRRAVISEANRACFITRIGNHIGEYLATRQCAIGNYARGLAMASPCPQGECLPEADAGVRQ